MPFTAHATLTEHDGPGGTLESDLVFVLRINAGETELRFVVPRGFETNLASVPAIFWPILPPFGKWSRPAILHDYLYSKSGECSRQLADSLFLEAMQDCGVGWWQRQAIYYAVRAFGWGAWKT